MSTKKSDCIIGIDPGLSGGITWFSSNGKFIKYVVMPTILYSKKSNKKIYDLEGICKLLSSSKPLAAYLEKVSSRPGEGVVSSFNFGQGYGSLMGIMTGLGIKFELISPVTWQKFFFADRDKSFTTKEVSIKYVEKFWPAIDFLASPRSKKKHTGLVDSFLIGRYGFEKNFK